ncbi:MAG: hypothetical protein JWP27_848 [Flaviaesturariibacter sp.]|nr:hypothetical protein [Flaviaesturariibacter sp.]
MQMTDPFELPVTYQGKEILFPAQFEPRGYSYRIRVELPQCIVYLEPDEDRNFRAMIDTNAPAGKLPPAALLEALVESMGNIES